ncbi:hypothetical protein HBI31_047080 [Parastagonospora nodorum]|nr:hypothetical protein HBI31_047080 [Parastagonospora nodorum]
MFNVQCRVCPSEGQGIHNCDQARLSCRRALTSARTGHSRSRVQRPFLCLHILLHRHGVPKQSPEPLIPKGHITSYQVCFPLNLQASALASRAELLHDDAI